MRVLYFQTANNLNPAGLSSALNVQWCLLPGGVDNPDTTACQLGGAGWHDFNDGINKQLKLTHLSQSQFL